MQLASSMMTELINGVGNWCQYWIIEYTDDMGCVNLPLHSCHICFAMEIINAKLGLLNAYFQLPSNSAETNKCVGWSSENEYKCCPLLKCDVAHCQKGKKMLLQVDLRNCFFKVFSANMVGDAGSKTAPFYHHFVGIFCSLLAAC